MCIYPSGKCHAVEIESLEPRPAMLFRTAPVLRVPGEDDLHRGLVILIAIIIVVIIIIIIMIIIIIIIISSSMCMCMCVCIYIYI